MTKEQLRLAGKVSKKINGGLLSMIKVLDSDLNRAADEWRKDEENQFWCRTLMRCGCAMVEGTIGFMKQVSQECAEVFGVTLTPEEIEIVTEARISNKPSGATQRKFLPFRDNFKQTFRIILKAHSLPDTIDFGASGFSDLCTAFEARNRLMHPKTLFDLDVSRKLIEAADRGFRWYDLALKDTLRRCDPAQLINNNRKK